MLKANSYGAKIFSIKTGNPTYADDVAVVCIHKHMLQAQLNSIYKYSCKWRFKFNPGKSVTMIYGEDMCPDKHLYLGQTEIKIAKGDLHMGIYIGQDKKWNTDLWKSGYTELRKPYLLHKALAQRGFQFNNL